VTPLASAQSLPEKLIVNANGLYWMDFNSGELWKIAPLGGTATNYESSPAQLADFAVDAVNAYFIENNAPVVRWTALAGGGVRNVLTNPHPGQLPGTVATDGTWVYWSNYSDNSIQKTPVAGGDPTPVVTGLDRPGRLVVFGGDLYYATLHTISKVSTSGGSSTPVVMGLLQPANEFAVDSDGVYFIQEALGNVSRLRFAVGAVEPLATGRTPRGIAVDATTIYWTDEGTLGMMDGQIERLAK
jgi:streptogramin lyase